MMRATNTESSDPKPSFADFRAAVRYLLINEHGMPKIVADDVLDADERYLEKAWEGSNAGDSLVGEVAEELSIKPPTTRTWVKVDEGQVVVTLNVQINDLLERLTNTGLYGDSIEDVTVTLLCRGIEAVLPVWPNATIPVRR